MVLTYFLLGVTVFALIVGFWAFQCNKYLQKEPYAIIKEKTDLVYNRTTYILMWKPYLTFTTLRYKNCLEFEDYYYAKYISNALNLRKSDIVIERIE